MAGEKQAPRDSEGRAARVARGGRLASLALVEADAIRRYRSAVDGRPSDPTARTLRRLLEEHRAALDLLLRRLGPGAPSERLGQGSEPRSGSGDGPAPGAVGPRALTDLIEREGRWSRTYALALADGALAPEDRALVLSVILPQQRAHAPLLERLAR